MRRVAHGLAMIRGVDVSCYQPVVDWRQLVLSGDGGFAYAKCTEATVKDSMHDRHVLGARAAGVPVGSYCFGRPDHDVAASVETFLKYAWLDELRPFLDMEALLNGKTIPPNAADWHDEWCDRVKSWAQKNRPDSQLAKRGPLVYSFLSYFKTTRALKPSAFGPTGWDLMLSLPDGTPDHPSVGLPYIAHQFACNVKMPGQVGLWDRDVVYDEGIDVLRA